MQIRTGKTIDGRDLEPEEIAALVVQRDLLREQSRRNAAQNTARRHAETLDHVTAEVNRVGGDVVAAGNAHAVQITEKINESNFN